jgi:hypothetical protein
MTEHREGIGWLSPDRNTDRLENRYRRLLACYPVGHRAFYGEEMMGVLMSAATPQQRRPGAREALNLVAFGLRARLRTTLGAGRTPQWRDAAGVFGYLASVLIAAMSAYTVVADVVFAHVWPGSVVHVSRTGVALAIGWTLVAIAAGFGWPRVGAVGATLGVLGQLVVLAIQYVDQPSLLVTYWWRVVLAVAAAGALLVWWRGRSDTEPVDRPRPIGVRSVIAVAVAAILTAAAPLVESWTVVYTPEGPDALAMSSRLPFLDVLMLGNRPIAVAMVLLLITVAVVVLRLTPSIRRRVFLLALPPAACALVAAEAFRGFLDSSPQFFPPVYLEAPQWIALIVTPVLAFAVGAWMLGRYEQKLTSGALLA